MAAPWQQQPGEPATWYARFATFRDLGQQRTLDGAYAGHRDATGRTGTRATRHWREAAKRWHWRERAATWDLEQE